MASDRSLLERQIERVELRPFTLDGFHRRRQRKERNRRIGSAVVALVVAGATIGGLIRAFSSGPVPVGDPRRPFLGTWVATDVDGSIQHMVIRPSRDENVTFVVHDDSANVCSGVSSTTTGTGGVVGTDLVIPSPVLTCDDGSEPQVPGGPPPAEQLRNMTFVHHETDTLTDNLGAVWARVGGEDPSPAPATGDMWPQSSLEKVREAQRLADAGDPRSTWQVDPELDTNPEEAEIFTRFLREELGWEEFRGVDGAFNYVKATSNKVFLRCAPGRTNPLYPNDPGGCAPTISELRYETVKVSVAQPGRRGPSGIWVVTRSTALPPFEQVVPPSDAEATTLLEAFLQARIDGEGAEEFFGDGEIPLLYATTTGAPYERSEFDLLDGPQWPDGWMDYKVRLFAEDGGTVVEQILSVERDETGRLGLGYAPQVAGPAGPVPGTTENGHAVANPYSRLDGEVTFFAAPPWEEKCLLGPCSLDLDKLEARFYVLADPRPVETSCRGGPARADAEALAWRIRSDPDLVATEPVAVRVGGIEALRMDVVAAPGASVCQNWEGAGVVTETGGESDPVVLGGGHQMHLYLFDLPERLSARTLAIAVVAPEWSFERVVEAAAPIVDSFEFHTG